MEMTKRGAYAVGELASLFGGGSGEGGGETGALFSGEKTLKRKERPSKAADLAWAEKVAARVGMGQGKKKKRKREEEAAAKADAAKEEAAAASRRRSAAAADDDDGEEEEDEEEEEEEEEMEMDSDEEREEQRGRQDSSEEEDTDEAEGGSEKGAIPQPGPDVATKGKTKQEEEKNKKKKDRKKDQTETGLSAIEEGGDKGPGKGMEERTVFVGNLPCSVNPRQVKALFSPCGTVETVRLRSVAVKGTRVGDHGNQNLVRKVCVNKGLLDDETKDSINAYVRFAARDSVENALKLNSTEVEGKHIRVDRENPEPDPSRSVFLGGLPFDASEEEVRQHFAAQLAEGDAAIEGVRLIRDQETQLGKGFGYLLLRDRGSVADALRLHESVITIKGAKRGRTIRVMVCGKRTKGRQGKEAPTAGKDGGLAIEKRGAARRVLGRDKGSKAKKGRKQAGAGAGGGGGAEGGGGRKRRSSKSATGAGSGAKAGGGKQKKKKKKATLGALNKKADKRAAWGKKK